MKNLFKFLSKERLPPTTYLGWTENEKHHSSICLCIGLLLLAIPTKRDLPKERNYKRSCF